MVAIWLNGGEGLGIVHGFLTNTVKRRDYNHRICRKRHDPFAVTVFSRDDLGRTVLHVASEYGM